MSPWLPEALVMDIVWFLLIGVAAGWLASQIMKGGGLHASKSGPRSRMQLKVWPARLLSPKIGIVSLRQTFAKDDSMAAPKKRSRI